MRAARCVHFNEVDECAGVDALVTNRCWKALGLDPSTTLHDVRWGEHYKGDGAAGANRRFVWLLQISGAAPANHFVDGYAGAKQRAAAGHVLSARRRIAEGHRQARRDRLEPRVC